MTTTRPIALTAADAPGRTGAVYPARFAGRVGGRRKQDGAPYGD
jgi:hypothetical protein